MVPWENKSNGYAKFWRTKRIVVFLKVAYWRGLLKQHWHKLEGENCRQTSWPRKRFECTLTYPSQAEIYSESEQDCRQHMERSIFCDRLTSKTTFTVGTIAQKNFSLAPDKGFLFNLKERAIFLKHMLTTVLLTCFLQLQLNLNRNNIFFFFRYMKFYPFCRDHNF